MQASVLSAWRHSIFLAFISAAATASGATSLIDATTRNGSFESGLIAPWLGDSQLVQDPAFASDGDWYARFQGTPPAGGGTTRKIAFQFLPANPSDGRTFIATFDARVGDVGFDSLFVDFFARSSAGAFTYATRSTLAFPALSPSEWRTYQVEYQLPDTWDGDGVVSLQILFSRSGAAAGTTYLGYLDNVTLQAIPEPSALALLGICGLLVLAKARLQRRQPFLTAWIVVQIGNLPYRRLVIGRRSNTGRIHHPLVL